MTEGAELVKKGDKLFVRIDYKNNEKKVDANDYKAHIDYLENIAAERFFIGGGFENEKGGMIIFKANNLREAKEITKNDPIIKRGFYTFKIYRWNLVLLSEK